MNMQTTDETLYNPKDTGSVKIQGHIKIFDPVSNEVFVDKRNAIHYENFSIALANSISNAGKGFISEMAFGNGTERAVTFPIKDMGDAKAEVVHSLAKWKRLTLGTYEIEPGYGIYTDMNAIRADEELGNLHSLYVLS